MPAEMEGTLYLLFLNVLTAVFLSHCLSVWSLDYSNTIPFTDTSIEACQTKCSARPWCTGIGHAPSLQLCYLLHSEEDFAEHGGLYFNGHLVYVQKASFKTKIYQESENCKARCSTPWQTCSAPGCQKSECPPPSKVPNGRILGNLNTEFSKRLVVCDPGYKPSTEQRQIVCRGGTWSPAPSCTSVTTTGTDFTSSVTTLIAATAPTTSIAATTPTTSIAATTPTTSIPATTPTTSIIPATSLITSIAATTLTTSIAATTPTTSIAATTPTTSTAATTPTASTAATTPTTSITAITPTTSIAASTPTTSIAATTLTTSISATTPTTSIAATTPTTSIAATTLSTSIVATTLTTFIAATTVTTSIEASTPTTSIAATTPTTSIAATTVTTTIPTTTPTTHCSFTFLSNWVCYGSLINEYSSVTVEDCKAYCVQQSNCHGFNFGPGFCRLKQSGSCNSVYGYDWYEKSCA